MSGANIITEANRQADDKADDGLDIPDLLKISAERRKQAWREFDARHRSETPPVFGREMREVERAYRASIERDQAAKRASDEIRFKAMRAKAAAEKAERRTVKQAVEQQRRKERRGRDGAGTRARRAS